MNLGRSATRIQQHRSLVEWNDTRAEFPETAGLHDLVTAQARRTPEAIAVSSSRGIALTYGQLEQRSRRLAERLRRIGVGPESRVGIHVERSPEMVIALLGILRAGGSFLPLEPEAPRERLLSMLRDAKPRVIIVASTSRSSPRESLSKSSTLTGSALTSWGARLLDLHEIAHDSEIRDSKPLADGVHPEHPAYVLYTSGSTGRPKAVVISHRAVCNHRLWMQAAMPLTTDDRLLQTATLGVDGSIWEIFAPLIAGAQLVLAPAGRRRDPGPMVEILRRDRITVLRAVATWLGVLLDHSDFPRCRHLRRVCSVGEALDVETQDRCLKMLPGCALYNLYGPSEAAIHATAWLSRRASTPAGCRRSQQEPLKPSSSSPTVAIGRPIANVDAQVLSADLRPIESRVERAPSERAPGELASGELYLGGQGLARGYLHRPALTAQCFVPDASARAPSGAPAPGRRLYKTGDRVDHRLDGTLQFLGRVDRQVKVRGFRVELGEIERALSEPPDVLEAAVRWIEEPSPKVVAYLVARGAPSACDPAAGALGEEHVERWREIYDHTYSEAASRAEESFDLAGWDSSYTGRPLPAEHIEDAVEHTVERLMRLAGDRVLEIACGTGLLLTRVAPGRRRYLGTDLSPAVITALQQRLKTSNSLSGVELRAQPADDFTGVAPGSFDLVFCNSVVGHFPGTEYLLEVISGMVRAAAPGGSIVIGDVRNLPLLEALAASIETFKAPADLPLAVLRERVQRHLQREDRLAVDPAFFAALPQRLPRITGVRIWPKAGRQLNELTRFRFDVVLELDADSLDPGTAESEIERLDWRDVASPAALLEYLDQRQPSALVVTQVPNARVRDDVELARRLLSGGSNDDPETAGELREQMSTGRWAAPIGGARVDASELDELLADSGYHHEISWARCSTSGDFDLAFWRQGRPRPHGLNRILLPAATDSTPWSVTSPDRLRQRLYRERVPRWRTHLEDRLPDYMQPSTYVLLDAMPRTPSGKIDRRALPEPTTSRPELSSDFRAPRSAIEERLTDLWQQVLGLDEVGVDDSFFELGGHSLLGTRLITQIREHFGVDLPLRRLFDGPTVAEMAIHLARAQRSLPSPEIGLQPLARLPRAVGSSSFQRPLSFAQQRLWFLHRLHPQSPAYNSPRALRLRGALDPAKLEWALQQIGQRHEVLRTTCSDSGVSKSDGEPQQVIHPWVDLRLPVVDLERLASGGSSKERVAQRLMIREGARPFDLERGPLLRGLLVRLSPEHHWLLLNLHHIISDSWSEEILYRELGAFYSVAPDGRLSGLPELPIQYSDFAVWQRSWLTGEVLERSLGYWRHQLHELRPLGFPPEPEARVGPRSDAAADRGSLFSFELPTGLSEALSLLSLRSGTSLFITLLTAFLALLHRTTGQRDLAVGSPIANRDREEVEGLIGFFVNLLVMRAEVSGAVPFRELLQQVREVALGAYAHQDLPFERLVEELQPERQADDNPLFQVAFALHNVPRSKLALPGIETSPLDLAFDGVRFDLEIHLWPAREDLSGAIRGSCVYRQGRLEPTAIARCMAQFQNLLAGAVATPEAPIDDLPLLTHSQRHQSLVEWNETPASSRIDPRALPSLGLSFDRQATQRPDSIAMVAEADLHLTYRELRLRTDRLASELRHCGVGPEARIGLCVEPSAEMVVGLLAILKAGGAYLPLDPSFPRRRLRWMLHDAEASLLLIQPSQRSAVSAASEPGRRVEGLEILPWPGNVADADDGSWIEAPQAEASHAHDPRRLACVFYTSGSTGRPKGIGVTQGSVLNLALLMRTPELRSEVRMAQNSNLSFDAASFEIWGALLHGATLVVLPVERPLSPEDLGGELQRQRISTLFLTTAYFHLVQREQPDAFRTLQHLLFGGEVADRRRVAEAAKRDVGELIHCYGPTENTTFTTSYRVRASGSAKAPVPIGLPLPGLGIHVLGGDGQPLPPGSGGELFLAGAGLARGYLGRPARTAERFVPNPFSRGPGRRLYRSGDRVQQRPDGHLSFMARVDHQVKIRGFRVEPAEIEQILRQHATVRDAIVLPRLASKAEAFEDTQSSERRLVAYVVPRPADDLTDAATNDSTSASLSAGWRDHLSHQLPAYMVPSAFVLLEALPLTPNGKVDRQALPEPDGERPDLAIGYLAPRTAIEHQMAAIWAEVLGLESVGIRDNFFELGGHSLLAIQVISKVRGELQAELPLRSLFDAPTVANLCRHLKPGTTPAEREATPPASLAPTRPQSSESAPAAVLGRMEEGRI